jgi:hypothetical protein
MNTIDAGKVIYRFVFGERERSPNDPRNVLFLNGCWGIGKTYLLQKISSRLQEEKPSAKIIYYSLAGKASLEEIDTDLFNLLHPRKNKIHHFFEPMSLNADVRVSPLSASLSYSLASSFTSRISGDTSLNNLVLIFDDLERLSPSVDFSSLLGLFLKISESIGARSSGQSKMIVAYNLDGLSSNSKQVLPSFVDKMSYEQIFIDDWQYANMRSLFNCDFLLHYYSSFTRERLPVNLRILFKTEYWWNQLRPLLKDWTFIDVQWAFDELLISVFAYFHSLTIEKMGMDVFLDSDLGADYSKIRDDDVAIAERSVGPLTDSPLFLSLLFMQWYLPSKVDFRSEKMVIRFFLQCMNGTGKIDKFSRLEIETNPLSLKSILQHSLFSLFVDQEGRDYLLEISKEYFSSAKYYVDWEDINIVAAEYALFGRYKEQDRIVPLMDLARKLSLSNESTLENRAVSDQFDSVIVSSSQAYSFKSNCFDALRENYLQIKLEAESFADYANEDSWLFTKDDSNVCRWIIEQDMIAKILDGAYKNRIGSSVDKGMALHWIIRLHSNVKREDFLAFRTYCLDVFQRPWDNQLYTLIASSQDEIKAIGEKNQFF